MKLSKYLLIILLGFAFIGCEEFIDRPPLDAIDNENYWKTAGDLERYVLQYYPGLPAHGSGKFMEDLDSDNVMQDEVRPLMNGERPITNGNWISQWSRIRSLNIFFENYQSVEDDLPAYSHYLGEAYFFKAWEYFNLLQTYGDLPWYTGALDPDSEELYKPRESRTLVVDSILAQLDKATIYLDAREAAGNYRINKETALAFKSRVALYEGTWQKYHAGTPFGTNSANPDKYFQACVDAAVELIDGANYTKGLFNTGNPDEDYYTMFGLDNMDGIDEILFYRPQNVNEGLGNNVQFYTTVRTQNASITWSLVTSYLKKNGEIMNYRELSQDFKGNDFLTKIAEEGDPRLHATVWMPGDLRVAAANDFFDKPFIDRGTPELCATGFQIKKYSNPYSPTAGGACCNQSETGYIYFRYAEVLLNYAEALYELEGRIAFDELNQIRLRAGMPDFEVFPQSDYGSNLVDYGYEIDDELYAIRNERRVELALEGHRRSDIMRWAAHALFQGQRPLGYPFDQSEFPEYHPPLNEHGLIDYLQNLLPNGFQFRENQDYLDDIPQDELTLNPNIEQNPGW